MSVGFANVLLNVFAVCVKVYFGKQVGGLSVRYWSSHVLMPVLLVFLVVLLFGGVCVFSMKPSLLRIIVTCVAVEFSLLPLTWLFVLRGEERSVCFSRIQRVLEGLK